MASDDESLRFKFKFGQRSQQALQLIRQTWGFTSIGLRLPGVCCGRHLSRRSRRTRKAVTVLATAGPANCVVCSLEADTTGGKRTRDPTHTVRRRGGSADCSRTPAGRGRDCLQRRAKHCSRKAEAAAQVSELRAGFLPPRTQPDDIRVSKDGRGRIAHPAASIAAARRPRRRGPRVGTAPLPSVPGPALMPASQAAVESGG